MAKQIFRKKSLARLSSPEQLDLLMQVTTPKGWVALLAIGGLVICAITWGVWGTISTQVMGSGIMVTSGGVLEVIAPSAGRIKDIYVEPGDHVAQGQVIARIDQPALLQQIKKSRTALDDLHSQLQTTQQLDIKESQLEKASLLSQQQNLKNTITSQRDQMEWLKEKINNEITLLKQGVITRQQLADSKLRLAQSEQKIRDDQNKLQQLGIRSLQTTGQRAGDIEILKTQINEAEIALNILSDNLNKDSRVVSLYSGRILDLGVKRGAVINAGTPVLRMQSSDGAVQSLEAINYVPAQQGKKIRIGMKSKLSPSTVEQEEYGMMLGLVTSVSEFPVPEQTMMKTLGNEELVKQFSRSGAPIEVHSTLIPDPRTSSGYRWSSSKGPPVKVATGTLCLGMVTIREVRPISLVIPLFKKYLLGEGSEQSGGQ